VEKLDRRVEWSEPTEVELDGQKWLEFTGRCRVDDVPITYKFCVYSGSQGTFQIIGWTTQNLYARDEELMTKVMKSFRFPAGKKESQNR
jgi:hypothetical protein